MVLFIFFFLLLIPSVYSSQKEQEIANEKLFEILCKAEPAKVKNIKPLPENLQINIEIEGIKMPLFYTCQRVFVPLLGEPTSVNLGNEDVLLFCAMGQQGRAVEYFLKNGAQIDAKNNRGYTFLHCAVMGGYTEAVRVLIKNNISMNVRDKAGKVALHWASANGHIDAVDLLIRNKALINVRDEEGNTPLHWAVMSRHTEAVALLIKNNALINAKDYKGNTPLHVAVLKGATEEMMLLIENEAQIDVQNDQGDTPLHWASTNGVEESVAFLINKGALVDLKNIKGAAPLHLAIAGDKENENIVRMLIKNNALIDIQDNEGNTPLHRAAQYHHEWAIRCLLEMGADKKMKNKRGDRAVDLLPKQSSFVSLFTQAGAHEKLEVPCSDPKREEGDRGKKEVSDISPPHPHPQNFDEAREVPLRKPDTSGNINTSTVPNFAISTGMKVGGVCLVMASLIYGQYESKGLTQKEQMQKQNLIKKALTFLKKKKISVALGSAGAALLGSSFFVK